jgi:hypothetical protein
MPQPLAVHHGDERFLDQFLFRDSWLQAADRILADALQLLALLCQPPESLSESLLLLRASLAIPLQCLDPYMQPLPFHGRHRDR